MKPAKLKHLQRHTRAKLPAAKITWRAVQSSNVVAVGWDRGSRLYVQFKSTAIYLYDNVTRQRAVACVRARSVGGYLADRIYPHHAATKIIDGLRVQL